MRIFLAGATGALGKRLAPLLVSSGHHVIGMTRTLTKVDELRASGVQPAIADGLDQGAVMDAVTEARPDIVVHQMTALSKVRDFKNFDEQMELTNRLRTDGTRYLLAAAMAAGAQRFVAQSYTGWPNEQTGGRVKNEDDPLDASPPKTMKRTLDAIRELEQIVSTAPRLRGIALRYGSFYGPGTSLGERGDITEMVRKRRFPIVGAGAGVWSFIHIDDAAEATRLAIEGGAPGIYNIVDDEPAEVSTWLPELARSLGAKPPYRMPAWIARLLIGDFGMLMMTSARGSSNEKARRLLGWRPIFGTWREGFRHGLAGEPRNVSISQPR